MRVQPILSCALLALTVRTLPAFAFGLAAMNAAPLTQHQLELRYAQSAPSPYAMSYTDEAAQRLGVRDGRWEAFDTRSSDPLMPSLKGGVDHEGAMLKLQWSR